MNISDCLYHEQINLGKTIQSNLNANTLEEIELIQSVAKLLYKTKSVRKVIDILDKIKEQDELIYLITECNIIDVELPVPFGSNETFYTTKHESIPYSGC